MKRTHYAFLLGFALFALMTCLDLPLWLSIPVPVLVAVGWLCISELNDVLRKL